MFIIEQTTFDPLFNKSKQSNSTFRYHLNDSNIPPNTSAIIKYLFHTTKQHAQYSFFDVLMTVDWRCQGLRQLLKYILNITHTMKLWPSVQQYVTKKNIGFKTGRIV